MHGPWQCTFLNRFQKHLRCTFLHVLHIFCTFFGKWDLEMHVFLVSKYLRCTFCTFLHTVCTWDARTPAIKYWPSTTWIFLLLNTVIQSTDLTIHDFELHKLFNSSKNVHLKAFFKPRKFYVIFLRSISSNNICTALGKTQNAENQKPQYQHWKIGLIHYCSRALIICIKTNWQD